MKRAKKAAPRQVVGKQRKTLQSDPPKKKRKPAAAGKKTGPAPAKKRVMKPGRKPKSARAVLARKVVKVEWTPDRPIENPQHERFALLMSKGVFSQTSCYLQVYGEAEGARQSASRLMTMADIVARVNWLREQAVKDAKAELGEIVKFCLDIIRTPVGYLDEESPLVQEMTRKEMGGHNGHLVNGNEEVTPQVFEVKVKMPGKLDAAKLLTDLMGWKKPEEVNLNVQYERPEDGLKRAQAAGVDVAALLEKLKVIPAKS